MDTETRIITERHEKTAKLRESGVEPYPYGFDKNTSNAFLKEKYASLEKEQHDHSHKHYKVAGRLMTVRIMGKASFGTVQDETDTIQIFVKQDNLGEDYAAFKSLDMGDIVGVEGPIFKTKTGEISIEVKKITLLSKAIRPLPEKFHGVKDPEIRHRKRYLDLISNPEVRKTFTLRSLALREIRNYLNELGYLEVETPALQSQYGGAAARPFITKHNALNMDLYLRISPEMFLKRLLVGGFEKVYDINKNFRNEGIDFDHNPEFTMIEWYEAYADYNKMMDMNEELIKRLAQNVFGKMQFNFREQLIDLSGEWRRLPMTDAIKEYADINVEELSDEDLYDLVNKHDFDQNERSRGHMINFLFEKLVEEKLIQPTFIIDHPVEISPLTKKHRSKPGCVERAELFIAGSEFSNMYSELNDPVEQRARLVEQEAQRQDNVENNYPMDEDFCEALEYAMPPAGGIGIGIDRLLMLLTESPNIREVILFPTLRPENK